LKLKVSHKVMNYQGKIIALMVEYKNKNKNKIKNKNKKKADSYYLPCMPSTSYENADYTIKMESLPTKWIDDDDMWNDYGSTVDFLNFMHENEVKSLPCNPEFRIVEDGMVVGILTASNQFVAIDPPIQNIDGDPIPVMKSSNYIVADRILSKSQKVEDEKEDKTIKYIYLENEFYNAFRTTLRILMALFMNRKTLKKMHNICFVTDWPYAKKMKQITKYLKRISNEHVAFQPYDEDVLMNLHHVFACKTNDTKKKYCLVQQGNGGRGILLLPSLHLLSGDNNVVVYYSRLADELIRHRRVQLFMFYPDQYLNIGTQEYNVLQSEFIIPKSLLTPDYLKMKKNVYGKYAQTIPFEFAEPDKKAPRREPVDLIKQMEENGKKA
jgi:hypothetical protein